VRGHLGHTAAAATLRALERVRRASGASAGVPRASRSLLLMSSDVVHTTTDGQVLTVTIDRPEVRNAVDGPAAAALAAAFRSFELALWCDLRVAAENAVLGVFCRRFGVPLMDGGTIRLPRLIGHGRALDMILTGRGVGGPEALRIGLVDRLVPPGEALTAAQ